MEQSIGLQEQAVTQQRRVVDAMITAGMDITSPLATLRSLEANLAKLHAWRLRLQSLREAATPGAATSAAPRSRKLQALAGALSGTFARHRPLR